MIPHSLESGSVLDIIPHSSNPCQIVFGDFALLGHPRLVEFVTAIPATPHDWRVRTNLKDVQIAEDQQDIV